MDARTWFICAVVVLFLLRAGARLAARPGPRAARTSGELFVSSTIYLVLALWGLGTVL